MVLFKYFFDFLADFVLLVERFSCLEIDRFLIGFFSRIGGWGFVWEILRNLNLNSKIILNFWNEISKMFCLFFQFILLVGELLFFLICSYIKWYYKTEIYLRLDQYLFYYNFNSIFSGLFLFDIFSRALINCLKPFFKFYYIFLLLIFSLTNSFLIFFSCLMHSKKPNNSDI